MSKNLSVYTKPVTIKHIDQGWLEWSNSSDNIKIFNKPPYKYNRKQLENYLKNSRDNKEVFHAIHCSSSKEYIGNIKLMNIDKFHKSAQLGLLLGNIKFKGKGYGKIMLYEICKLGFLKLNLNRIYTDVYTDNYIAFNSYLKFGFTLVGLKKQAYYKDKKFKDAYHMEILSSKFKMIKKNYL